MSKTPITVRLPNDLAEDLRTVAELRGIAFNAVVTEFLRDEVTNWAEKQAERDSARSVLASLPAA